MSNFNSVCLIAIHRIDNPLKKRQNIMDIFDAAFFLVIVFQSIYIFFYLKEPIFMFQEITDLRKYYNMQSERLNIVDAFDTILF